jgi:hypothetical protein
MFLLTFDLVVLILFGFSAVPHFPSELFTDAYSNLPILFFAVVRIFHFFKILSIFEGDFILLFKIFRYSIIIGLEVNVEIF